MKMSDIHRMSVGLFITSFLLVNILSCSKLNRSISHDKAELELILKLKEDKWTSKDTPYRYVQFQYILKNNSNKVIYFNTLMAIDTLFQYNFFRVKIEDSLPPYGHYCRLNENWPPLTKQDTLQHIVKIEPRSSYTAKLQSYGCISDSLSIVGYYKLKNRKDKSISIQLQYDNSFMKPDSIWRGKLKSNIIWF